MRFILTFLFFFSCSSFQATSVSFDDWEDKMWLVHASSVMLKDSTAIASALKGGQEIVPHEANIHHRMTHHHCLGGLVPDQNMAFSASFCGIRLQMPMKNGHANTPFAYLEPWKCFKEEIIGGQCSDTFIFGNHTYGPHSIVIIPTSQKEAFTIQNPSFLGKVVTYDPETQKIRLIITEELKKQNAWHIDYMGRKDEGEKAEDRITINGEDIDKTLFEEAFSSRVILTANHNDTPFCFLETMLSYFTSPFTAIHAGKNDFQKIFLADKHGTALRSLANAFFDQIDDITSGMGKECSTRFKQWRSETDVWLNLYKQLKEAFKSGTFPKNSETLKKIVSIRGNPKEIENLLSQPPLSNQNKNDSSKFIKFPSLFPSLFPSYWDNFEFLAPETLQSLLGKIILAPPTFSLVKSSIAIKRLMGNKETSGKDSYFFKELLAESLSSIKCGEKEKAHFSELLFGKFADENVNETDLLKKINLPEIRKLIATLYEKPELISKEEITLEDILPFAPGTRYLYGKVDNSITHHGLFMISHFLREKPNNFREAMRSSALHKKMVLTLSVTPLGTSLENNPLLTILPPTNSFSGIERIKAGDFGTLDEIFAFYGVQAEFRKRFPSDDLFWNQPPNGFGMIPIFSFILEELEESKSKNNSKS